MIDLNIYLANEKMHSIEFIESYLSLYFVGFYLPVIKFTKIQPQIKTYQA